MQVCSNILDRTMSISQVTSAYTEVNSSAPVTAKQNKPEDYLTIQDVAMIKYVSGAKSLEEAELNQNAKALAESLGIKRQYGYVQGDASRGYFYSQLTDSDAKMIEGLTGTTTIIDAMAKATPDIVGLTIDIAIDREDGSLKGDVSKEYLQNMICLTRARSHISS